MASFLSGVNTMRLDKLLANLQYASRKHIKKLARDGLIRVNHIIIKDASQHVDPENDIIEIGGERVIYYDSLTLMMNKRRGVVSARVDDRDLTVMDDLDPVYQRHDLHIAGRLDKDTEGLLILTTDGKLLHDIISPKKDIYKYYEVIVDKELKDVSRLEQPMTLLDGNDAPYESEPAIVEYHEGKHLVIGIKEGKFHQVKRMIHMLDANVVYLKRIRINHLSLDEGLAPGEVKPLDEVAIKKLIE